jgi:hypothetical protein
MTGSKFPIFSHPGKITGYWITTRSFPYRANMGVSAIRTIIVADISE